MSRHFVLGGILTLGIAAAGASAPPEELPVPPLEAANTSQPDGESSSPSPVLPAPTRRASPAPTSRIESLLAEARQQRALLHEEVRRARVQTASARGLDGLRQDLRASEQQQSGSLRDLHEKLAELDALLEQGSADAYEDDESFATEPDRAAGEAFSPNPLREAPPRPNNAGQASHPAPAVLDEPTIDPSQDAAPAEEKPVRPPTAVLPAAVDRMRLADSLFAQSQWKQALEVYEAAAKTADNDHDRLWVEYQQANCHRRLANTAQAEKFYRIVAGADAELLADCARWQLDNLQKRKTAEESLERLKTTIAAAREGLK